MRRAFAPCIVATSLVLVALAPAQGRAQGTDEARIARVEQGLLPRVVPAGERGRRASIVERMRYHGIPGMSIAVVDEGRVAWARAYGVRDADTRAPVTTTTLFQAASVSKPVAALGALWLVQSERAGLDADVRRWLRSWKPDSAITLRQLLCHTAGLGVSGFAGYAPGAALPTTSQILDGAPPANSEPVRSLASPGTGPRYSGGGYVVVQQLVTDVTGQTFDQFMRRSVFAPLSMTRSTFEQPLSTSNAGDAASGHRRGGARLEGNWMIHPELAAAGLWTTPTDLAQVIVELQDALAGRPSRLLSRTTAREMLTARADNAGLGVFLAGPNGQSRRLLHSGRNAGFDAMLVAYKNGRQGAVVMINRNNNERFIDEVLESVAREYHWRDYDTATTQLEYVSVPAEIQAKYVGTYDTVGRPSLVVVFEDQKLFARTGDDPWFRLYPASDTEFFAIGDRARWTFDRRRDGTADAVIVRSGADELRRTRTR